MSGWGTDHRGGGKDGLVALKFIVIIASDTIISRRSRCEPLNDRSGEVAESLIVGAGHSIVRKIYLPNSIDSIRGEAASILKLGPSCADILLTSGGTGPGPRDVTVEAVAPLLERSLPGFGELFRRLSYDSVGTATIASRALAGIAGGVLVFLLPGSTDAVQLALEKIILPEAPHLLRMVRMQS